MSLHENKQNKTRIESLEPLILMSATATDGNDVLISQAEGEAIDGLGGHDIMIAFAGDNAFDAGDGHDTVIKIRGDNDFDGGDGNDTLVYWIGNQKDFVVTDKGNGVVEIDNGRWTDIARNFENIQFNDGTVKVEDVMVAPPNTDGAEAEPGDTETLEEPETADEPNLSPVAKVDEYFANVNEKVTANVSRNDSDPDGLKEDLRYTLKTPPPAGTVRLNEDGSFVYTPPQNFVGAIQFEYYVKDVRQARSEAQVRMSFVDFEELLNPDELVTLDDLQQVLS